MSVDTRHPLYIEHEPDWKQMLVTYKGQRPVKETGFEHLPPTGGMVKDGATTGSATEGALAYDAYRKRARFPDVVKEAVESMLGVMHHKEANITLPAKMEPLIEKATLKCESLQALLRRINEEQLKNGRLGLLLEFRDGEELPHIALYEALDIINWDEGEKDTVRPDSLNLVVINESEEERVGQFNWEPVEKYRVLSLGSLEENEESSEEGNVYKVVVVRAGGSDGGGKEFREADMVVPASKFGTIDRIPFVFVNTKDIVPTPDEPPLLGLSNLALTIYRGEADYRQALFLQGQDTLVISGGGTQNDQIRTGTGSAIMLPEKGTAAYIGVDSQGLPEMRVALENDYAQANQKANALLEAVGRSAESGEALRVRVSARTASLNQIAKTAAFAVQELLRIAAEWLQLDPKQVIIEPNLDFVSDRIEGKTVVDYMVAKSMGAPIALKSIHTNLFERGLTQLSWEDELKTIEMETGLGLTELLGSRGSTNPDGPVEDADPKEGDDEGDGEGEKEGEGGDDE